MALEFMDGFDTTTTIAHRYGLENSTDRAIAAGGRTGNRLRLGGNSLGGAVTRALSATAKKVVGAAVYFTLPPANAQQGFMVFREGATIHLDLRYTTAGALYVTRAGTTLGSISSQTLAVNSWHYIEFMADIHDSTGAYEVRVNGVTWLSGTGADTRNGGTGVINTLRLHCGGDFGSYGLLFDDLYVDTTTFHGDVKVEVIRPNGAGASTNFTPSAGSNFQNVDDADPNDDTDYNASSTAGHKDTFTLDDLATTAGSVIGIQSVSRWRKDDAGSRTARPVIRSGGTDYPGTTIGMTDSYLTDLQVRETDPATSSPFSIAGVNALQAGYELVS